MVLGTAQFGMDYGIANVNGKPSKKEVFSILDLAWEKGIRRFDTSPSYGSESLLGEYFKANGLQEETKVLTKIPPLGNSNDYRQSIKTNLESSLKNLGCHVEVLFFHNPADSKLLLEYPEFFKKLLNEYPVTTLGVSVYEPKEVELLLSCNFELAFQFPLNVLDRQFEKINMPLGKRYARSVFLQGLLASPNSLRREAREELLNLQKKYNEKLTTHGVRPVVLAISFVAKNDAVDYFLIGVDSEKQLQDILNLNLYNQKVIAMFDGLPINTKKQWLDPKNWSLK